MKGETKDEIVATDADGVITINGLYAYETNESGVTGEYTLQEIVTPQGYVLNSQTTKFRVDKTADGFKLNVLEGAFDSSTIENDVLKVEIKNDPIFTIVKKDGETAELIPNVKFAIYNVTYDENSEEVLSEAFNAEGNSVGTKETINGTEYQVITTDENGEINLDLVSGIYKVVEVETLDKYELPENEDDRTYYIAVGDTDNVGFGASKYLCDVEAYRGGYSTSLGEIVKFENGYFTIQKYNDNTIISGKNTEDNNNITIKNGGNYLVKYNSSDKIQGVCELKIDNICGFTKNRENILIYAQSTINFSGENTADNNDIKFNTKAFYRITINSNLKVVKVEDTGLYYKKNNSDYIYAMDKSSCCLTGCIETDDGGRLESYIIYTDTNTDSGETYYFTANVTKNNEQIDIKLPVAHFLMSGLLLKYDSEGKLENYQVISSDRTDSNPQQIKVELADIKRTPDGGYIAIGSERYDAITFLPEDTVSGNTLTIANPNAGGNSYPFIVKFNSELKAEWIHSPSEGTSKADYGQTYVDSYVEESGDIIVVGQIGENYRKNFSRRNSRWR